jgi:hypothetical protein
MSFGPIGSAPIGALPIFPTIQASIDSANWTGIETRLAADPGAVARVSELVSELHAELDRAGLTNYEKATAHSLTRALIALVASPEPEWKVIALTLVTLFNSKAVTAACNAITLSGLIGGALKIIGVY